MRITDSMISNQFLRSANSSLNRVADAQTVVDTTKRINNIDDDPLSTVASLKARNKLSNLAGFQDSIKTGESYLKENENATQGLNKIVQSTYELMVSAASAKTDDDRSVIADEISSLRDEILSIGNTTLGTSYLFSGNSSKKPFSTVNVNDATHLIYNGVDLTKNSLYAEYTQDMTGIDSATTKIANELQARLEAVPVPSDYDAKNFIVPGIVSQLNTIIQKANTAITSAKKYGGIDATTLESLQALVSSDSATSLTSIKTALESEISKPLDLSGGTKPNTFSLDTCKNMVSDLMSAGGGLAALQTGMDNLKTGNLDPDIAIVNAALDIEKGNVKELVIGNTQKIQVASNGIELLGTGTSNLYYMLDKCVNILNGNLDKSLLSDMPAALQEVQSNVLSVQTTIGASRNRLTMISDRYTATNTVYAQMRSDAEDADMAQAIIDLTTAKTVYNAALAAGSKIIQTSLVDFLR